MRFRYLFLLISFVLLPVSLVAFDGARPERGGPTPFPHKVHIENGIECTDCHTGARDEDTAGLPTAETCFDCHDTPEDFSPTAVTSSTVSPMLTITEPLACRAISPVSSVSWWSPY